MDLYTCHHVIRRQEPDAMPHSGWGILPSYDTTVGRSANDPLERVPCEWVRAHTVVPHTAVGIIPKHFNPARPAGLARAWPEPGLPMDLTGRVWMQILQTV
jgi:hypothetical protein